MQGEHFTLIDKHSDHWWIAINSSGCVFFYFYMVTCEKKNKQKTGSNKVDSVHKTKQMDQ